VKNFKSVNIWQSYKQEGGCFVNSVRLATTLLKDRESARYNHVVARNYANIHRSYFFTNGFSNKPFLIWLLTTTPHLECVATLPCYLPLTACFLTLMLYKV